MLGGVSPVGGIMQPKIHRHGPSSASNLETPWPEAAGRWGSCRPRSISLALQPLNARAEEQSAQIMPQSMAVDT